VTVYGKSHRSQLEEQKTFFASFGDRFPAALREEQRKLFFRLTLDPV
jgi:hypothetical protein